MKNRYLTTLLIPVILALTTSASAESKFEEFKLTAVTGNNNLKIPPANAFEFLQNIKYAIEMELFLDDSFFEPENLLLFTNAKSVKGTGKNENWLTITQANIEGVQRSIEVTRKDTEAEKVTRLAVSFFTPSINADYIIKIFGPVTRTEELSKKFGSGHPIPFSAKTHPFGNMEICQIFINKKTQTEMCSLVSGDGQVGQSYVAQTREK
jgi:hypothetical protein